MATLPSTSAGPPPSLTDPGVAVWEWQDEFGRWRPYRSSVCSYIEQSFQVLMVKGRRSLGTWPVNGSIPLGQADSTLAPYIIDLPSLTQFRQDTGTMRAVHRHVFQLDSAPGQGVVWEWQNDEGSWLPYEMSVCVYLEQAFSLSSPQVDLGTFGYNYGIDFVSQTQTNKTTGYQRRIRRCVDSPYPIAAATGPAHSGPTCSCQQCLLNSGTGPITSRYRHSMVNLPGHSSGTTPKSLPGMQGANRNSGLGASLVGFVPYNKPTLSGARSMPRLNAQSPGLASQSAAIGGSSSAHTASKGTSIPENAISQWLYILMGEAKLQISFLLSKPREAATEGPEHPSPGLPYTARGFPRYCYLPDNEKGRKVLELLRLAWRRRLIFTIGTSSTTGRATPVVWNEIHHKTEMASNVSGHGYPDPNYLDNVLAELAAQGVTEDCLSS
ncbi:LOW QUALITY PROTEIN: probable E3 ubiquitin-protein ligase DTX2 [Erythrolamprus reginae]|uniref:LOW QUALITY PROTEIN: probable E3 ubiquitin-protein ligase DTX2 n=1 Tax=Erythrolamprus reginae TaxID=121349 RepID=UPI00396D01F3